MTYDVWGLSSRGGYKHQLTILNFTIALLVITIALGASLCFRTMPDHYISTTMTIFGSLLGVTAVIFSYSRVSYLIFLTGLIMPGVIFLLGETGPFYVINALLLTGGFFAFSIINLMEYAKQRQLFDARQQLSTERHRSEKLLLNILPAAIAEELKQHGRAKSVQFDNVTVFFTDFVGFTRIAEHLSPTDLVGELDRCFSYFDNVAQKYGLEKLKTIGDSYMAAGGIPVVNKTHPFDCALAALEIQAFMKEIKAIKKQQGFPHWELRLGMHNGPLVAGVVGEKKFSYDVWGDTVNTASRMESSGVAGAINISKPMYEQIKLLFHCEYRGKVLAKNKGKVDMYFLHGIKPKYSVPMIEPGSSRRSRILQWGCVPNAEFKAIYEKIKNGARLAPNK